MSRRKPKSSRRCEDTDRERLSTSVCASGPTTRKDMKWAAMTRGDDNHQPRLQTEEGDRMPHATARAVARPAAGGWGVLSQPVNSQQLVGPRSRSRHDERGDGDKG